MRIEGVRFTRIDRGAMAGVAIVEMMIAERVELL